MAIPKSLLDIISRATAKSTPATLGSIPTTLGDIPRGREAMTFPVGEGVPTKYRTVETPAGFMSVPEAQEKIKELAAQAPPRETLLTATIPELLMRNVKEILQDVEGKAFKQYAANNPIRAKEMEKMPTIFLSSEMRNKALNQGKITQEEHRLIGNAFPEIAVPMGGLHFVSGKAVMTEKVARQILKVKKGATQQQISRAYNTQLHKPEIFRKVIKGTTKKYGLSGAQELDILTRARDTLLGKVKPITTTQEAVKFLTGKDVTIKPPVKPSVKPPTTYELALPKPIAKPTILQQQLKKPEISKFITPSDRYARTLGVYELIEPSIVAKRALELERASKLNDVDKLNQAFNKIKKVGIAEKAKAVVTGKVVSSLEGLSNKLDKFETASAAGLTGKEAEIFTEMKSLKEGMLERVNEIRKLVDLKPIEDTKAYLTQIRKLPGMKDLAEKYPIPDEVKSIDLFKNPFKALKVMVSVDLKQIYLEQPTLLFEEQIKDITMPAETKKWVVDYVDQAILGKPTPLDNFTNETFERLGIRQAIDMMMKPFGKTTGFNAVKQMTGQMGRLIHSGVMWGRAILATRNHTQKLLGLGIYGIKSFAKASFPASKELKDTIKGMDFWKSSNRKFLESEVGLSNSMISNLEKLGYKLYAHSHISNVTHTMKTAYYAGKELVDNSKYAELGWTMDDVTREMEFGAETAQYWYNIMSMPEIFRSGTLKPLVQLQSWWMNYTMNYWREMITRLTTGKTGWGKKIPWKWRLASLRHVITSLIFVGGMMEAFDIDYTRTSLLGAMPSGLSPAGQFVGGLWSYIVADTDYQRTQAVNDMKYSYKAFIPGSVAYREFLDLWSGDKSLKEYLFHTEKKKKPKEFKVKNYSNTSGGSSGDFKVKNYTK